MSLNLTTEQIIQLAPDDASVKAGKGLATAREDSAPQPPKLVGAWGISVSFSRRQWYKSYNKFPDLMAAALSKQDIQMWAS